MFDSHAHYDDRQYDGDREELLSRLFTEEGVTGLLTIGCNTESSHAAIRLAEAHSGVYAAVGFHPEFAEQVTDDSLAEIERLLSHPKAVALGEIGLDYYYEDPPRDIQKTAFRAQLALAERTGMPVIVHDRDAHGDLLAILQEFPSVRGVLHSYSGSAEMAKVLLSMGWYISFSGVVTFKNARQAVEVAEMVPSDRFLTETDAPYLTPVPYRGKRNDSGKMRHTLQRLAEIRQESFETIEKQAEANARRLFGIESE
ncbi:MAG: TatD family hydrolase [Oscillospiraceae bacterium]|nr:TatD family hydrolase [Oscillospiraceae bacterium]